MWRLALLLLSVLLAACDVTPSGSGTVALRITELDGTVHEQGYTLRSARYVGCGAQKQLMLEMGGVGLRAVSLQVRLDGARARLHNAYLGEGHLGSDVLRHVFFRQFDAGTVQRSADTGGFEQVMINATSSNAFATMKGDPTIRKAEVRISARLKPIYDAADPPGTWVKYRPCP